MDMIGKKGVIAMRGSYRGRYGEPQEGLGRDFHILL